MESEEHKQKVKDENKLKQSICKNADWSRDSENELVNTDCTNERRNGSAFCQECSDKHHS